MRDRVLEVLADVAAGKVSATAALERLSLLPLEEVRHNGGAPGDGAPADAAGGAAFARLDHNRALRQGQPEVVFGPGKTIPQLLEICRRLARQDGGFLVTRVAPEGLAALAAEFPAGAASEIGRTFHLSRPDAPEPRVRGPVLVVTGGTGDLPVAEEAAVTAAVFGNPVERLYDVGVAGIHRVLSQVEALRSAAVLIVVAGMEGALPSVVGGLVDAPVIAVPTSVGYGAAFGGLAPLLGMLNSCAAGVTVVNIDNGFGAAVAATRINALPATAG